MCPPAHLPGAWLGWLCSARYWRLAVGDAFVLHGLSCATESLGADASLAALHPSHDADIRFQATAAKTVRLMVLFLTLEKGPPSDLLIL